MTTDDDNPCLNVAQGNLAFYQALLADYKQAWECLYINVFRSFMPYARQRSAISTDDALDILQEGMAEFAIKLKNGKYVFQEKPVAAYVFTVCRNRWVSYLRKNHIQKLETMQDDMAEETDSPDSYESTSQAVSIETGGDVSGREDSEASVADGGSIWSDSEVDWEAVGRAFADVGADCQTMLHCFYVEEKSLGECGARIGLQENSAKVKRFRCAQRMKALYSQYKTD
ncbi:sigma-70 family RNA polymerase sigma factor [Fibrella sp. HMF5335]|uniref:Sigma-70 family RNA polymerase sigma factor n=1 Tax=Fibrella rubiginis TaxID=2817060 RepID=A0A939GED5_9BACT|nr:sigma-70 family RNA polymerase sigma factor [Fibrella rubiginis]MBO0935280.1 sigma-70 family RNA polymerase sigma factor [Fibrella rubiginis]